MQCVETATECARPGSNRPDDVAGHGTDAETTSMRAAGLEPATLAL
jgi:hypothetical protein